MTELDHLYRGQKDFRIKVGGRKPLLSYRKLSDVKFTPVTKNKSPSAHAGYNKMTQSMLKMRTLSKRLIIPGH